MTANDPDPAATSPIAPLPTALPRPPRRASVLPWLIPLIALAVAAALILQSLASRGPRFTLAFSDGRGLKPNDPIVHRGVQVGRVRSIGVDTAQGKVLVQAELTRDAADLASSGCFWIVYPEISISRISGLETLLGPRYIAAASIPPGESSPLAREFPPPLGAGWSADSSGFPGALVVNIRADRAGSISVGSPVSFRETPVGGVLALTLAEDGRSVLITAAIRPEHAHLLRANSVFWNVSGIGLDLGLVGGLKLKAESLQTIFAGGLAFATPDKPGDPVTPGHEFTLGDFDDAFLKWSPNLSAAAPADSAGAPQR